MRREFMKFKKWMVGILCATMALGAVGCSSGNEGSSSQSDSTSGTVASGSQSGTKTDGSKKVEISYWSTMNPNVVPVAQSYGDIAYFQELEKITGVKINFLHPPVGQESDQFKLLISSRKDLPDVIVTSWLTAYPGGPEKAIKDGIIIPLNAYLDLMPNYKKAMEANEEMLKQCKTDEGTIYAFQGLNQNTLKAFGGMMLRADWLEELGLEEPETIEEWEKVLIAFRDQKGATVPLSVRATNLMNGMNLFNAAFEIGYDFYLDEQGVVQYGPIQENYKAYLALLNRWYEMGLLDPDFASIDDKIVDANILNGKTGATFGWIGGSMGKWYKAATEEGFELVAVANPVLNKGDQGKFLAAYTNQISGPAAAISTTATNVEEIIQMFDFLYTEEGMLLKNFGIEGLTYEIIDGEPIYTDLIMNNPDGLAIANALGKYVQANYGAPGFTEIPAYQDQYYQLDAQKEGSLAFNKYVETAAPHVIPPVTATPDESKDLATIMTDVNTFREEQFVAFVTGAQPLDKFDDYVAVIKSLDIERAIAIKQAGIERYNKR